jgi:hypothetical protein
MCVAIVKPRNKGIKKRHLKACYDGNPHGCGFAYAHKGTVEIVKGVWNWEEFWAKYKELSHHSLLIHFRWATSGDKDDDNCHPWTMQQGKYALIHNGVLSIKRSYKSLSDTGNWVKLVMEPMLASGVPFNDPAFVFLVEEAIGSFNKFAVMDGKGQVCIYNEQQGEWHRGVWFSNDGYKTPKVRTVSQGLYGGAWHYGGTETPMGYKTTASPATGASLEAWRKTNVEPTLPWREREEFLDAVQEAMEELNMDKSEAIDFARHDFNLTHYSAKRIVDDEMDFPRKK